MKRILLLSTGGTIASVQGENGQAPGFTGEEMVDLIPELKDFCLPSIRDILNLDSTNMQPEEWKIIAREAFTGLREHDGVVITHGTDTMAYTAAMLSFMLKNLHKPVILTGSRLPIDDPATDGKRNILHSCMAACRELPGVYIVFDRKIINGTRAVKLRSGSFNAFESINCPPAGRVEQGRVVIDRFPRAPAGPPELADRFDAGVFLLKLIPGTRPEFLDVLADLHYRGVVVESFGAGGLPGRRRDLLGKVELLLHKGIAVVVATQCLCGGSDLTVYEVGQRAARAGVIPALDMTTETAVTKLMWALGHTGELEQVKRIMLTSYCGEINP